MKGFVPLHCHEIGANFDQFGPNLPILLSSLKNCTLKTDVPIQTVVSFRFSWQFIVSVFALGVMQYWIGSIKISYIDISLGKFNTAIKHGLHYHNTIHRSLKALCSNKADRPHLLKCYIDGQLSRLSHRPTLSLPAPFPPPTQWSNLIEQ